MNDPLSWCHDYPQRTVARGETLIREGERRDCLYVLRHGSFDVRRDGVCFVRIAEPGAFLGEISAVLQSEPSATLVAGEESVVHVIEDASAEVRARPELTLRVAQVLARRLRAVTAYLVDIKRQYAGTDSHLEVMDRVLAELSMASRLDVELGSERADVPDYD